LLVHPEIRPRGLKKLIQGKKIFINGPAIAGPEIGVHSLDHSKRLNPGHKTFLRRAFGKENLPMGKHRPDSDSAGSRDCQ
jgi:hypothetical protein